MKPKITYHDYTLEFLNEKTGKWENAGDVYRETQKRRCLREMVFVNFMGKKVRMVSFTTIKRQVGKVKDFS